MSDEPKTAKEAQPGREAGKGREPRAEAAAEAPARKGEGPAAGGRPQTPPTPPPPAPKPAEAPRPAATATAPPGPAPARSRNAILWVAVILALLGVGWLAADRLSAPAADPALAALASRIAALEGRAAPAGPDLRPQLSAVEARLTEVERRAAAAAGLADRVAALERTAGSATGGPAADAEARAGLAALGSRLAALEQRPAPPPPPPDPRIATLADRVAALEARPAAEARLAALEARMTAFVRAHAALEAGRPLGPALAALPHGVAVPASLAAFADRAPPTLALLRLRFAEAARAAREVREPASGDLLERAGSRIAGLVTVRRGDTLLLGDATAGMLAQAERRLDAGDLAGTVALLADLPPRAAEAMAGWTGQARALLAARDGLAALAAGS